MYLSPPQPVNSDILINGDVEIHPSASIAPGVILQAAPQCRIVIGADVCLGMGVILSVDSGTIEVERGAALGSGVLVVGASKIGNNACVGTATTIFKATVPKMAVIPPGSLIGDTSRQAESEPQPTSRTQTPRQSAQNDTKVSKGQNATKKAQTSNAGQNGFQPSKSDLESSETQEKTDSVVGRVYIDRLMMTLFPYKKKSNYDTDNDSSNGDRP